MKKIILIVSSIFMLLTSNNIDAQYIPSKERGNPSYRTQNQLEINQIRTTIFNNGQTGRQSGDTPPFLQTPYEWPKNSGQFYLALTGILIGGEVVDDNGDTLHIIDIMNYRSSPDTQSWNLEPVPGYYNEDNNKIASSTDPTTWPSFWPDKMDDVSDPGWPATWNGYLGKNKFIKGQEIYYKLSDDSYDRYPNYFPDSTDLTRKGLGLLVSCRSIELSDPIFRDMVFLSYTIKNDGTKVINKMGFTNWIADFIGGNGDTSDDVVKYDLNNNLINFYDSDNRAPTFYSNPVGAFGVALLKTPVYQNKELGITNVQIVSGGALNINSDEQMWNQFMIPGNYTSDAQSLIGEYDTFISSDNFSLQPGESTEVILVIIFANGPLNDPGATIRLSKIRKKLKYAKSAIASGLKFDAFNSSVSTPLPGQVVSGNIDIKWLGNGGSGQIKNYIFYSPSYGDDWIQIGYDSLNSGTFSWNTSQVPDGVLNKIRILSFADNGISVAETDSVFTINNPGVVSDPQIYITSPKVNDTLSSNYNIKWLSGDADGAAYTVSLYYKNSGTNGWINIVSGLSGVFNYVWNTNDLPNASIYDLMGVATGSAGADTFMVNNFTIQNLRTNYSDSLLELETNSIGTGAFEIHVINPSVIKNHKYVVQFDSLSGNLVYNVFDQTLRTKLISNATEVNGKAEGPYFDGLRLFIQNDSLRLNNSLSGWSSSDIYPFTFERFFSPQVSGIANRADYKIVFGDVGVDTSNTITYSLSVFPPKPVNFKVYNLSQDKEINFGFMEIDTSGGVGIFSSHNSYRDRICFLEKLNSDSLIITYWVYMTEEIGSRMPVAGDSLILMQYKPFLKGDTVSFSMQNITGIEMKKDITPSQYKLEQNYPNPFNPSTRIRFTLKSAGNVVVKIYDILGREVKTLLNKKMNQGSYEIVFDASNLSSGVYFYSITAGSFRETKKMVLLK